MSALRLRGRGTPGQSRREGRPGRPYRQAKAMRLADLNAVARARNGPRLAEFFSRSFHGQQSSGPDIRFLFPQGRRRFRARPSHHAGTRALSVWQDVVALEGGQDWWSQIENALRSKELQHFVLVVTTAALESGVVKQEIRLARQEGKSVSPVRGTRRRRPQQAAALARPRLRSRPARAENGSHRQTSARGGAAPRADDGAGTAFRLHRPSGRIRRAESVVCSTPKAIPSPASPRRCAAPAATARRRSPRRSPATPISRTPISTESCGPNWVRNRDS